MIFKSQPIADQIFTTVKERIDSSGKSPKLALLRASDDIGTLSYEKSIEKKLTPLGIEIEKHVLKSDVSNDVFFEELESLNNDETVDAILVFKPLPEQIDADRVDTIINPKKDPDGFSPINLGELVTGNPEIVPATPAGIVKLLDFYDIDVKGKNVTIVNNSAVIGKPLALLLTDRFATVSLCHVYTKDLESYTKDADILITAAGVPDLIKPEMVSEDVLIIDAGIASKKDGEKRVRVGDVSDTFEEENVKICSVTNNMGGGVGPITTAVLAENILKCANI